MEGSYPISHFYSQYKGNISSLPGMVMEYFVFTYIHMCHQKINCSGSEHIFLSPSMTCKNYITEIIGLELCLHKHRHEYESLDDRTVLNKHNYSLTFHVFKWGFPYRNYCKIPDSPSSVPLYLWHLNTERCTKTLLSLSNSHHVLHKKHCNLSFSSCKRTCYCSHKQPHPYLWLRLWQASACLWVFVNLLL